MQKNPKKNGDNFFQHQKVHGGLDGPTCKALRGDDKDTAWTTECYNYISLDHGMHGAYAELAELPESDAPIHLSDLLWSGNFCEQCCLVRKGHNDKLDADGRLITTIRTCIHS